MATEQVVQPVPRRRMGVRSMLQEERVIAYIFVAPSLIVIAAIAFWPIIQAIWYSLLNYIPTYPQFGSKFVGLQNYVKVYHDSTFTSSIGYTVLFMVVSVALEFVLGLLFALVLNQRFRGRGLARAAVLVPWAFPTVISAVVWRALMWQNNTGAIPAILHTFGLVPATWAPLASNGTLMAAMIIIDVWKTAPFMALLLLAGLQVISEEVYEAGRVDGANVWQRFFQITLPLLKPAILVALLFRTLDAWRVFDLFWVLSNRELQSLSTFVYEGVRISQLQFAQGNAASVFIFVTAFLLALFFIKVLGMQTSTE